MNKQLNAEDFQAIEEQLRGSLEADKRYWQINDVKCDAVYTAKTYEEFSDRVAAAHLRPLEKADALKKENYKAVWNCYAKSDEKNIKE